MAHPNADDIRRSHGDKLDDMTGARGEHPMERAARIAGAKSNQATTGDAAAGPAEEWTAAPARQISNLGNVRK